MRLIDILILVWLLLITLYLLVPAIKIIIDTVI